MLHNKDFYRNYGETIGMTWGGCDDGVHFFQAGDYSQGFTVMHCLEEDLTNGNAEYMAKHGLTLSPEKVKRLQSKYRKQNEM